MGLENELKREKCYTASGKIIGPCGPCSLINLVGWKGSPKLEKSLSDMGKVKPFCMSDFTSFLIWNKKYNLNLKIFVNNTKLTKVVFDSLFMYENTPNKKRGKMKLMAIKRHSGLIKQNKYKIFKFKEDSIDKIDSLLSEGYRIAYLVAVWHKRIRDWVGHWRVVYGKQGRNYLIKDSSISKAPGLLKFTRNGMKKSIYELHRIGSYPQLVAFKPN